MRSPGTEEVENPLPLPNKGCCRPCQPLLSALFLTRKLRWDRGGPWASTKALWNHAVTPAVSLPGPAVWLPSEPAASVGPTRAKGPRRPAQPPPCPLGRPGTRLFHEVGAEGQAGFSAALCHAALPLSVGGGTGWLLRCLPLCLAPPQERLGIPKGSPRPCQEPGRPLLAGGGPVAVQEAPCPEALSPSLSGPDADPCFLGTPSLD